MYQYAFLILLSAGQVEMERVYGPCHVVRNQKSETFRRTTYQCKFRESVLDLVEDLKSEKVTRAESTIYSDKLLKVKIPKGCRSRMARVNKSVTTQSIICEN